MSCVTSSKSLDASGFQFSNLDGIELEHLEGSSWTLLSDFFWAYCGIDPEVSLFKAVQSCG